MELICKTAPGSTNFIVGYICKSFDAGRKAKDFYHVGREAFALTIMICVAINDDKSGSKE